MKRLIGAVAVLACTASASLATASGAHAATHTARAATDGDYVTVQTYTPGFKTLISKTVYGSNTKNKVMPAATIAMTPGGMRAYKSGNGGSSTSSGCRKVTVTNTYKNLLGSTAYKFNTTTSWCWTRSSQVVKSPKTGWYLSDVGAFEYWKGTIHTEFGYYDYGKNDGHPKSAYKNYRQGRFENCVIKYGCISTTYPANTLRSYYNGTWAWSTSGT